MRCPYCRATIDAATVPRQNCPGCARDVSWLGPETNYVVGGTDLWRLGRGQRIVNTSAAVLVILLIIAQLAPPLLTAPQHYCLVLAIWLLIIRAGIGVHHMYAALHGMKDRGLWGFSVALAFGHLLTYFIMNLVARRAFRRNGLSWRVQGWTDQQLLEIFRRPFCHHCGYDLTGNTTGRCPECGRPSDWGAAKPEEQVA